MKNLTLIANTISKEYRSKTVVNSVSLEVNQGEIVGLLGPNGAGKTTSFYIIVGLIQPNSGKIFLGSEDITSLPMYKRARKGIGYLAQEASVFRNLKKDISSDIEVKDYIIKNQESLKLDYIDFSYSKLTPQNLTGLNEFDKTFFKKEKRKD